MSKFGLDNLAGQLDPGEVAMYAQTAELAGHLTKPNRDRLAHLTKSICEVVEKQTVEEMEFEAGDRTRRPFIIRPLTTPNDIRMQFFDGKEALFKLLPHPPLLECEGHAYSLYSDCVRDALGKGYDLDCLPPLLARGVDAIKYPLRDIMDTPGCKRLFDIRDHERGVSPFPILQLWMMEWSDDADPNNSIKSNRGSLWFKSLTVGPTREMIHSMSHTYPLAMGHKNANHEHVGICLKDDLLMLGAEGGVPMYSKKHGGIVLVRARLFACLQDQPERRGENHLMAGNSLTHRRFGYSFPWDKFADVLRPCQNCRDILLDETMAWECPECDDCTNFAYDDHHSLLVHQPHELFPIPLSLGEGLGPLKLTYDKLIDAVTLSHDNVVCGLWSLEEAEQYLQWHCLKTQTLHKVLKHAERCKEYNDIMEDPESTNEEKRAVTNDKTRNPSLYLPWPLPSLWTRGVQLNQCPDVPMHLIFLGCVKTVMLRIEAWMTNKRKAKPFAERMKHLMESIDELKLSWIKIIPYKGGRFGGWVSENYLAMSRILKWFYSLLDEIASDKADWVEPVDRPQVRWRARDNKAWLRQRGLKTGGLAKALAKRVDHYMTKVDPVPEVVEMKAGPVETVLLTVASLDELISLVMVEEIPNEEYYSTLERKIRIFLTHFADMEDQLPRKKDLPQWLSSYNFMSLLNLPEVIRQYGPIRNIWEGGPQGEGVLRFVKPNMLNGMRRAWELSTMKTLMRKKAMEYVADPTVGTEEYLSQDREDAKMFHSYKDVESLDGVLRDARRVVSCILLEDGRWGVCSKVGRNENFYPLSMSGRAHNRGGLDYFLWERQIGIAEEPLHELSVVAFGLLLPLLQYNLEPEDDAFVTHCYSLISSCHQTLDATGALSYA